MFLIAVNQDKLNAQLLQAISANNKDIQNIQDLLKQGANVNAREFENSRTLFHTAVLTNLEIVQLFFEYGADIHLRNNILKRAPLHCAVQKWNNIRIVEFLIKNGADIMAKDLDDNTPLHIAAKNKDNSEIVKLLINNGANVNEKNKLGCTPLISACSVQGNIEVVKSLHQFDADLSTEDNEGLGLLHHASCNNNEEIIEYLLKNEADVNALCNKKRTPLYYAARWGCLEIIKILLQHGAEVHEISFYSIDCLCRKCEERPVRLRAMNIIRKHLIKLKTLNFTISDEILESWDLTTTLLTKKLRNFEDTCKNEAKNLQELICTDRNVKFSDLLTKNLHNAVVFLNVDEISEKLKVINFDKRFPIYSDLLKWRIGKCMDLAKQFDRGYKSVQYIVDKFRMPDIVLRHIFTFLKKKDDLDILNSFSE